jgi:hypothetical protein
MEEISDPAIQEAERRMAERLASGPHAVAARYDRRVSRVMVTLSNGLELAFPPYLAEGLAHAKPADLAIIEISPAGLGLHWPKLDADLYLPALLHGVFGSPRWMAGFPGRRGVLERTEAKVAAALANGRKG